jgi:two-component system sensor histidine kinase/response regulator
MTVSDTGIGLAPDKLDSIFDKFTQADASTTRKYGGTGLGLTICKLLVEMMEGEIGASSVKGKGSSFWFELNFPLAASLDDDAGPDLLAGLRLLCVDGHPAQRSVMHEHLADRGVRVLAVGTARDALDALATAREPFSVALIDHELPDMDGAALGAAIHADPRHRQLKLVLTSSLVHAADNVAVEAQVFAAFLSKPVPQHRLIDTLLALLSKKAAQPELELATPAVEEDGPLKGYRILAVDDNPVNLQVVTHMLTRLGASVDTAENGRQAIDMFCAKPYALILMDCQMPELDGYQAATEIRNLEQAMAALQAPGEALDRVPIIALTAHALEGEREKCLAAGMDDFLTKPLRSSALRERLAQWLAGPLEQIAADTVEEEPADAMDAARKLFGAKFPALARAFLGDAHKRMAALGAAIDDSDADALAEVAHALAGSASAVGATLLGQQCKQLEKSARSGQLETADEQYEAINSEFALVEARLGDDCSFSADPRAAAV